MNNRQETPSKQLLAAAFVLLCALILGSFERSAAGPGQTDDGPKVYWSDKETGVIWRAYLDGSNVKIAAESLDRPEGLALNMLRGEMYVVTNENGIEKMDLNGADRQTLVEGYPLLWRPNTLAANLGRASVAWSDASLGAIGEVDAEGNDVRFQLLPGPTEASGLAVDESAGQVYWLRHGRLYQSNLDGSDSRLFKETYGGTDMTLDVDGGKIYYSESDYDFYGYSIQRANLDGSEVEVLAGYEQGRCDGIALDLSQGKVIWSERGKTPRIMRANLDGTAVETIIDEGVFGPFGLAVDEGSGKLYWADWVSQKIQRANLDGSGIEDLLSSVPARPRYLTLDTAAGKLYWTGDRGAAVWQANLDGSENEALVGGGESASTGGIALHRGSGRLYWVDGVSEAVTRAKVDGTGVEKIIYGRTADPQGLALDEAAGKMYWADRGYQRIMRANWDGSAVEVLVASGIDKPTSLALDLLRGKMVWAEPFLQQIKQANLDGSGVETLLGAEDGLKRPNLVALDAHAGKMYWTDWGSQSLHRANLDGTQVEDLVTSGIVLPSGLALGIPPLKVQRSYIPLAGGG